MVKDLSQWINLEMIYTKKLGIQFMYKYILILKYILKLLMQKIKLDNQCF